MLTRVLTIFAMITLGIGAYSAYADGKPFMAVLLTLGTIAAAIPAIMDPRK
jgi:putative effector of murein hydrolase